MKKNTPLAVFAVQHKDEYVRSSSRSGGIFTALTDEILRNGGVVYGCVLNEDFKAVHVRTEDIYGRDAMRGSKYIQSEMQDIFRSVQDDLRNGRQVLFSGTPCQLAGLKSFICDNVNLICLDIVCHGVPSKKVYDEYISWQEKRTNKKIVKFDFRNKKDFGWRAHIETMTMSDGTTMHSEVFKTLFYSHTNLRPSCYECPYKSLERISDITMADYWGIEKVAPEFDDNKGVSLVLVNTEAGKLLFEDVKSEIRWTITDIQKSLRPSLIAPFPRPANRSQFWQDFQNKNFSYIAKKYGGLDLKSRIKKRLRPLKKLIGRL